MKSISLTSRRNYKTWSKTSKKATFKKSNSKLTHPTLFFSFNIAELSDANLKLVDRFKKLQVMVKKTVSSYEEQQAKKLREE